MVNAWAFGQLETFVRYKAEDVGIEVVTVDPRNTSRTCPRCGIANKASRSGAQFKCTTCGYRSAADLVAARAIAERHACSTRAVVNRLQVPDEHCVRSFRDKPPALAVG